MHRISSVTCLKGKRVHASLWSIQVFTFWKRFSLLGTPPILKSSQEKKIKPTKNQKKPNQLKKTPKPYQKLSQDGKPIFHKSLQAKSSQRSCSVLFMPLDRSQFDKRSLVLKIVTVKSKTTIGIPINTLTLYYTPPALGNYSPGVQHYWERWLILLPAESNI